MATTLLKRLPLIIGLLLLLTLCGVGVLTQLDFSSGITDNSAPASGTVPAAVLTPVDPPSYGSDYCVRTGDWDPTNPFTGWPTDNTALQNSAYITMFFCDPTYGQTWEHEGLDFGFYLGTNIIATADAEVVQAGFHALLGNMVLLCSSSWCARYGHMDSLAPDIFSGATVTRGTILGQVGQTGNAFGVHLHYDMYNADGFWDPFPTLSR